MAKNINIHIKTRGAEQTKQQLQGVGKSAEKVGDSTEKMGEGAKRGGSKVAQMRAGQGRYWEVFSRIGITPTGDLTTD